MFIDFSKFMTRIFAKINGDVLVGIDEFGNKYYQSKKLTIHKRPRRWVDYDGVPEASKVPAEWFGWLHYTTDKPFDVKDKYAWQKQHTVNLTGTKKAPDYIPTYVNDEEYKLWEPK